MCNAKKSRADLLIFMVSFFLTPSIYANFKILDSSHPTYSNSHIVEIEVEKNRIRGVKTETETPGDLLRGFISGPEGGPLLVLWGGITTNAATWIPTAKYFNSIGVRTLAMNPIYQGMEPMASRPAPGRIEAHENYDLYKMVDHIVETAPIIAKQFNGGRPFHYVGHSLQGIVLRMAMLGYSYDSDGLFMPSLKNARKFEQSIAGLYPFVTPAFDSLDDRNSLNPLTALRLKAGIFLLTDAIPKYYEMRSTLMQVFDAIDQGDRENLNALLGDLHAIVRRSAYPRNHDKAGFFSMDNYATSFLKMIIVDLLKVSFRVNKKDLVLLTSKNVDKFKKSFIEYIVEPIHPVREQFLAAEQNMVLSTLKKPDNFVLKFIARDLRDGFFNIRGMEDSAVMDFLRDTMSDMVHSSIPEHLDKILASDGKLLSSYPQNKKSIPGVADEEKEKPHDLVKMFLDVHQERKEAFTTSRIVSNFLDLEEYFQIERSLRSKMHYLSDPKDPIANSKRIQNEAKSIGVNHEFINTGHCGAGCEEKAEEFGKTLYTLILKNEEMTRLAVCRKYFH